MKARYSILGVLLSLSVSLFAAEPPKAYRIVTFNTVPFVTTGGFNLEGGYQRIRSRLLTTTVELGLIAKPMTNYTQLADRSFLGSYFKAMLGTRIGSYFNKTEKKGFVHFEYGTGAAFWRESFRKKFEGPILGDRTYLFPYKEKLVIMGTLRLGYHFKPYKSWEIYSGAEAVFPLSIYSYREKFPSAYIPGAGFNVDKSTAESIITEVRFVLKLGYRFGAIEKDEME